MQSVHFFCGDSTGFYLVILVLLLVILHIWKKLAARILWKLYTRKLPMLSRVRQCTWCKANIRGYDHHCPAFGTCIGQKNHRLFMALLTGFVVAESTYTMCSTKCMLFVFLLSEKRILYL
ncbi:Palmitoyltransferase AKR1 [Zea mays]|uniref:S-acyltransferase n=1 Tax=Zea mays TaxID=4577 RepID=A0A1D6JY37_MAIZE|nr:Palmitoyltransferase AKR1 [Zea mays]